MTCDAAPEDDPPLWGGVYLRAMAAMVAGSAADFVSLAGGVDARPRMFAPGAGALLATMLTPVLRVRWARAAAVWAVLAPVCAVLHYLLLSRFQTW